MDHDVCGTDALYAGLDNDHQFSLKDSEAGSPYRFLEVSGLADPKKRNYANWRKFEPPFSIINP